MSDRPYVRVRWIDTVEVIGWMSTERILEHHTDPMIIESWGMLMHKGDDAQVIAGSMGDVGGDDEQMSGIMTIPNSAVLSCTEVEA